MNKINRLIYNENNLSLQPKRVGGISVEKKSSTSSIKHALCLLFMEKLVYVFSVSSLVTIKCQSNVASLKKTSPFLSRCIL